MPISKQKKVSILSTLDAGFKTAETIAFVNFYKLPGKDLTQLRRELREAGVTLYVAKKTLVKRALETKNVSGVQPELKGELALAWGTDPVAPAKGVFEFIKTHKDQMSLQGGVYQGAYMSQAEITQLATILTRDQLLSKFVGMLNESIARVVRVINERANGMESAAPVAAAPAVAEVAPIAVAETVPEVVDVPVDAVPAVA
jgi:large subunit ribosomal protein L10